MINDDNDLTAIEVSQLADQLCIPVTRMRALGFPDHCTSGGETRWPVADVRKWTVAFLTERQLSQRFALQRPESAIRFLMESYPPPSFTQEDIERSAAVLVRCARSRT